MSKPLRFLLATFLLAMAPGCDAPSSTSAVQASARPVSGLPKSLSCKATACTFVDGQDEHGNERTGTCDTSSITRYSSKIIKITKTSAKHPNGPYGEVSVGTEDVTIDFADGEEVDGYVFKTKDLADLAKGTISAVNGTHELGYWWADGDHVQLFAVSCTK